MNIFLWTFSQIISSLTNTNGIDLRHVSWVTDSFFNEEKKSDAIETITGERVNNTRYIETQKCFVPVTAADAVWNLPKNLSVWQWKRIRRLKGCKQISKEISDNI